MRTTAEKAANRSYVAAADRAESARRNYDARRARKGTHTQTLDRARAEWGLARIEQANALVAKAAAEDAARLGGVPE